MNKGTKLVSSEYGITASAWEVLEGIGSKAERVNPTASCQPWWASIGSASPASPLPSSGSGTQIFQWRRISFPFSSQLIWFGWTWLPQAPAAYDLTWIISSSCDCNPKHKIKRMTYHNFNFWRQRTPTLENDFIQISPDGNIHNKLPSMGPASLFENVSKWLWQ